MSAALEAVLRRDRAVVIAALAIITILAWTDLVWLANDMWMDGMDMTGFRMIPAGQGWMMPASAHGSRSSSPAFLGCGSP